MIGPDDDTAELAQLLGLDEGQTVAALGTDWRRARDLSADTFDRWFVTGDPPQVAVGSDGFGFALARPAPTWDGVASLVWHFDEVHRFQSEDVVFRPDALADALEEMARGRRRTFRWCRMCRTVHAPETFLRGDGVCMGCAGGPHRTSAQQQLADRLAAVQEARRQRHARRGQLFDEVRARRASRT